MPRLTKIEEVAKAQWAARCRFFGEPETPMPEDERAEYRRHQARAAIQAMRSPDKRMLRAAAKAMSPAKRPTPERVSVTRKHAIRYVAMVDAALAEVAP